MPGNKKCEELDYNQIEQRLNVSEPTLETIQKFLAEKLNLNEESDVKEPVLQNLTFKGLTDHWKEKGFKNIVTMVGAGISTSAGIPDFRSPTTGLYSNLEKYNLPNPTAIFEMEYFRDNPQPFFTLAKELYPGSFVPTPSHYFIRLLNDKGLLVRHYTQNIDTLDRIAGIPEAKLVEAHGSFYTNHCLECNKEYSMDWMKEKIFEKEEEEVVPMCEECNGVVKPDIVFFGENLPPKFYIYPEDDFKKCDLLIIMGTSLEVHPFAGLVDKADPRCVRLLINRDKVGQGNTWYSFTAGLKYESASNVRDVAFIGDCDEGVFALADALGWGDEFRQLIADENKRLNEADEAEGEDDLEEEEEGAIEGAMEGGDEISISKDAEKIEKKPQPPKCKTVKTKKKVVFKKTFAC